MPDTSQRQHLHLDDCPQTLRVLGALFNRRLQSAAEIGYEPTEHGAWVDWDQLEHSWLSSTERAAVIAARGIAAAERQGGWSSPLYEVLVEAVTETGTGVSRRRRPGD